MRKHRYLPGELPKLVQGFQLPFLIIYIHIASPPSYKHPFIKGSSVMFIPKFIFIVSGVRILELLKRGCAMKGI